jgi:hypothetical protein
MNAQTTAALYGAIGGAVVAGLINALILVARHFLKRRGGIEFTPSNWRFSYLAYGFYQQYQDEDGTIHKKPLYSFLVPDGPRPGEDLTEANHAIYGFTPDILNKMDVAEMLRDVSVAFLKNGAEVFTHRPFDEDNTDDRTPVVFELPPNRSTYDIPLEEFYPPGHGVEPIGTISVPAHDSKRIRFKGYIAKPNVHHLHGGCDEVRFHAVRENGKSFDERIALQKTVHTCSSGGQHGGKLGM